MASKKGGKKGSKKSEKAAEEAPPPAEEKKEDPPEENPDEKQQETTPAEETEPVKDPTPPPEYDEPTLAELIVEHYEGDKVRGLYDNEGVAYFSGGHCYKGQFSQGLMHGKGTYLWTDGVKYEGDFNLNEITGKGTYSWPDGSVYEGEVMKGRRHGHGTFRCMSSPSSYTGQWNQGQRHGTGIIRYDTDGLSFYEGDWVSNQRHGYGVRRYRSGNVYEGEWVENNRHGQGVMRWVDLNQSYSGQWDNGIQHGHGEHTWYLKRLPSSQYPLRNQYIGDFVYGKRHGYGVFLYANGAKYEGEWTKDKKSGRGVFTFKNGRVFDGVFVDDRMAEYPQFTMDGTSTPDISGIRTRTPDPAGPGPAADVGDLTARTDESRNTLGPSLTLDLQHLLRDFGEEEKEDELQQVMFVILRHVTALKKVYSFYSSLGHDASPDNTFIMTRLQFWRFLKDCRFHHLDATLAQMDRILVLDKTATEIHSPLDKLLVREFLNHLITLSYHLFRDQYEPGSGPVLAWCLSKAITENIVPYGCDVQGNFLYDERHAVNALGYMDRCYEVYQEICCPNKYVPYDSVLKMREFLHTMNDYGLVSENLSAKQILDILSSDDPAAYDSHDCNLELEMTFLDFFEAVIGCAMYYVTEQVIKDPATPRPSTVISNQTHTSYSSTIHGTASRTSHHNEDGDDQGTSQETPRTSNYGSPGPRAASSSEVARKASDGKVETHGSIAVTGSMHADQPPEGSTIALDQKGSKSEAGTEAKGASMLSLTGGEVGVAPSDPNNESQTHLLQSMLSMGAEEVQQQQEAVEEMEEEMDEETRSFNFWTHQINIFFLRKLFPAHQHMRDVNAKRVNVREDKKLAVLQAEREREEREQKVVAAREAERLAEEARARELAAAASETGAGGNETIDGSLSDIKVERSKSNSSTKGK